MKTFTEAIKLKGGILHNLDYHQQRLDKTLHHFYSTHIDLSDIHHIIPPQIGNGLYKCRVVYSDKILSVEFQPYQFRSITRIGIVTDNQIDYAYKYQDRSSLNNLLERSGCDDIIIVKNSLVTDASASNLVLESTAGHLYTPESCLLPGTKRQSLLDRGIIKQKRIGIDEITDYTNIYFINALIDLEDQINIPTNQLVFL